MAQLGRQGVDAFGFFTTSAAIKQNGPAIREQLFEAGEFKIVMDALAFVFADAETDGDVGKTEETMSRLYVVESRFSLTGGMADHRLRMPSSSIGAVATALAAKLGHPALLQLHDGSYASFASHIAQSKLYVGYDSAGQHVASAAGIALVSIFTGYVAERMFFRWRPATPHAHVVAVDESNRSTALARSLKAIEEAAAEAL